MLFRSTPTPYRSNVCPYEQVIGREREATYNKDTHHLPSRPPSRDGAQYRMVLDPYELLITTMGKCGGLGVSLGPQHHKGCGACPGQAREDSLWGPGFPRGEFRLPSPDLWEGGQGRQGWGFVLGKRQVCLSSFFLKKQTALKARLYEHRVQTCFFYSRPSVGNDCAATCLTICSV